MLAGIGPGQTDRAAHKGSDLSQNLSGCRVLIVEDEYFIAEDMANALIRDGAEIVGPFATVGDASEMLDRREHIDLAVLDINLQGEMSFAIARRLTSAGVPFLFATGYEESVIPAEHRDVPMWKKPFDTDRFVQALAGLRN